VMKRINNKAAAVEACITRLGTIVGPFMIDLTGYPELTPYKGGWCGNDLFPEALTSTQRATAVGHVQRLGGRLAKEGYKGFLEIDVLVDTDTDEVYLGELNPRISGASSMTNVTAGAYADVPLFLFHLLEFMDVDYVVDVEDINERWLELAAIDVWAQLIMKEPVDSVERILAAPRTGTYRLDEDGKLTFARVSHDWHQVTDQDEAFYMRVYAPGDFRFKGADLGILVTKGRMQSSDGLTERCVRYIDGIRSLYYSEPVPEHPPRFPSHMSSRRTTGAQQDDTDHPVRQHDLASVASACFPPEPPTTWTTGKTRPTSGGRSSTCGRCFPASSSPPRRRPLFRYTRLGSRLGPSNSPGSTARREPWMRCLVIRTPMPS